MLLQEKPFIKYTSEVTIRKKTTTKAQDNCNMGLHWLTNTDAIGDLPNYEAAGILEGWA